MLQLAQLLNIQLHDGVSSLTTIRLSCCRYSSYGRHFTKEHLLLQVAQLLSFYLHDGDTIVDFSCGANAFLPLVKKEGGKQGLSLKGRAFDIITSQNLEDFERCSWLDTRRGGLSAVTVTAAPAVRHVDSST